MHVYLVKPRKEFSPAHLDLLLERCDKIIFCDGSAVRLQKGKWWHWVGAGDGWGEAGEFLNEIQAK